MAQKTETTGIPGYEPIPDAAKNVEMKKMIREQKILLISLDAGYRNHKIIINDEFCDCVSSLPMEKSHIKDTSGIEDSRNIEITYQGTTYVIGQMAEQQLLSGNIEGTNRDIHDITYSDSRWSIRPTHASILAAIAFALKEYAEMPGGNTPGFRLADMKHLENWNVIVSIAVPLVGADTASNGLHGMFSGPLDASMSVGRSEFSIHMDIPKSNLFIFPQAIAATSGLVMTPYGTFRPNDYLTEIRKTYLSTLCADAGYRTVGFTHLDPYFHFVEQSRSYLEAKDEAYRFSMYDVDSAVCKRVYDTYSKDQIDRELVPEKIGLYCDNYVEKRVGVCADATVTEHPAYTVRRANGEYGREVIDLKAMREEEIEKRVEVFARYLNDSDIIGDLRSIMICGGTGMLYYPAIKKIFNTSNFPNITGGVRMLDGYCDGLNVGSLYAVCWGLYCQTTVALRNGEIHLHAVK